MLLQEDRKSIPAEGTSTEVGNTWCLNEPRERRNVDRIYASR